MEIKKFKGLKNTTSSERLGKGFLEVADNVDIDDTGKLLTRVGTVLLQAGSYHSLWAEGDVALVSSGQDLYRIGQNYALTWLTRSMSAARRSFARLGPNVYTSNGMDTGRVCPQGYREWGVRPPIGQPLATAVGGELPAGLYQYALTFRRADGTESGTGVPGLVRLDTAGGVAFSQVEVPTDPDVSEKALYLSGPDGTELFEALVLEPGVTAASYQSTPRRLGRPLDTMFDVPPPAGALVEVYNGCSYVVSGNAVFYSRPYRLENFRLAAQFLQFPGQVRLFSAVRNGIYAATDEATWFLSGANPLAPNWASVQVLDYGAIPGTAAKTTLPPRGSDVEELVVMWTTPSGVCVGRDGGVVSNVTQDSYAITGAQRGAGIVRQARGYTQYLAALEGAGVAGNVYQ